MINFTNDSFNIFDYRLKDGDIKVKAEELQYILFLFIKSLYSTENIILEEEELNRLNIFINKYIVLGSLRLSQKEWYDTLKKFDNENFTMGKKQEEIDKVRREVLSYYYEYKSEAEKLANELNNLNIS